MRSLFVVSQPRSLSTLVHAVAAEALGLRSPAWTSAGEILNPDRFLFGHGSSQRGSGSRFVLPERRRAFTMLTELLDDAVAPRGAAYKDVLQPFALAHWLSPGNHRAPDLAVLHLRRSVADVALAMKARGWTYPADAAGTPFGDPDDRLLRGLLRADAALASIPNAETVTFDDLVESEAPLRQSLERLYPVVHLPPLTYLDAPFRRTALEVLRRRQTPEWKQLAARVRELREEAEEEPSGPTSRARSRAAKTKPKRASSPNMKSMGR